MGSTEGKPTLLKNDAVLHQVALNEILHLK